MSVINSILSSHPILLDSLDALLDTEKNDQSELMRGFDKVVLELDAHETAEDRTLYAALEQDNQTRLIALQGEEEHRIARRLVDELKNIEVSDDMWLPRMVILRNFVSLHMQIEENNVLPVADRFFAKEDLEQMGNNFEVTRKMILKEPIPQPSCPQE